ncbi:MAG: glycosyltransferase family 2 protein [Candidatus Hydrogenedentota bacterium]
MNEKKINISVFFPAYNDEGTIASLIVKSILTLNSCDKVDKYEIIVVDDASPDNLNNIVDFFCKMYPDTVRLVRHSENRGYGGALISGFKQARYDHVFYTDGDGQYDVCEMKLLIDKAFEYDLVNGYKIKRHDPIHRIIIGYLYNLFVKIVFNIKLRDVDCDFRLLKKSIFDKIELHYTSGVICVELIKKIEMSGFKIAEVPVHHYFRALGHSQFFNFTRLFKVFITLIKLWFEIFIDKTR